MGKKCSKESPVEDAALTLLEELDCMTGALLIFTTMGCEGPLSKGKGSLRPQFLVTLWPVVFSGPLRISFPPRFEYEACAALDTCVVDVAADIAAEATDAMPVL